MTVAGASELAGVGAPAGSILEKQDGTTSGRQGTQALPIATIANGLPGATDFVPVNNDPVAATRTDARYYDVTLSAAGTTTMNSTATIDNLTISGAGARLIVSPTGSLTSLLQITQLTGYVQVDGTLATKGDYFLLSGGLAGSGRIDAPFLTNATGMIAPGIAGTIGTLTIGGNAILSSGSTLLIDLGGGTTSDRIAVVSNTGTTADGKASIGGFVGFAPTTGATIRDNDLYTILTAQNGVTGTFANPAGFSAILTPKFIYNANSVQLQVVAGRYSDVVSAASPVQLAYAQLLDQSRAGSYGNLAAVYGPLDLASASTIQSTLEGLAPRAETTRTKMGTVALDNMNRFYRDRLSLLGTTETGGTVAVIGKPLTVAALGSLGNAGGDVQNDVPATTLSSVKVPDDVSLYLAGGYLVGNSAPMPTAIPLGGRDTFDGWYLAGGVEKAIDPNNWVGFSLNVSDLTGRTGAGGQRVKGKLYQGALYAKSQFGNGFAIDGIATAGLFETFTRRPALFFGTTYNLRSDSRALVVSGEAGASLTFDIGSIKVGPRIAGRGSLINFTKSLETGGPLALTLNRRDYASLEGRAGLTVGGGSGFRPVLSGYYVHEFKDQPAAFDAQFVGGAGPGALFALAGTDKDWAEVSGGLAYGKGAWELSVQADTTIWRKDIENQSYRGTISYKF